MTSTAVTGRNVADSEPALQLTSAQRFFFGILLSAIHQICNVVTSVILQVQFFWTVLTGLLPANRCLSFEQISDECKSTLTKRPAHIAIAFLEPASKINLKYIADVVAWSWASGANYVSLYDIGGHLKRRQFELLTEVRRTVAKFGGGDDSFSRQFRLEWHPHLESENLVETPEERNVFAQLSPRNGKKNGELSSAGPREIHLSLLSARDGRQDLVEAARQLAALASNGQLQDVDAIDQNLIGQTLQANRGIPDPDILVRVGLCNSNLGFLPWQMRLTEIYDWPTLSTFRFRNFFGLLKKFSKCEQRFGH